MTELIWDGKYQVGKKTAPERIALPFQTIETVNESAAEKQINLGLYTNNQPTEWSNCLIWSDNNFESDFVKILDHSEDVTAFAKLTEHFGFCIEYTDKLANIRHYYPDFVVKLSNAEHWIVETKGREDVEVALKDDAASNWCDNATQLTGTNWKYLKVLQKDYEKLHPDEFNDLLVAINNQSSLS